METKNKIAPKGKRLNWIPIQKSKRIDLNELNPVGKKLDTSVIRNAQRSGKDLLIP